MVLCVVVDLLLLVPVLGSLLQLLPPCKEGTDGTTTAHDGVLISKSHCVEWCHKRVLQSHEGHMTRELYYCHLRSVTYVESQTESLKLCK